MPVLFKIGPIKVYSYGLIIGAAFLIANHVASEEFRRKGLGTNYANQVTILAIVLGLAGSRILYLIEDWGDFLKDPLGMAFSAGGLTWYGGFILAGLAIIWTAKRKGFKIFDVADALAPALILGYGVGRLGCHFSGDGYYGIPPSLPFDRISISPIYRSQNSRRHRPDQRALLSNSDLRVHCVRYNILCAMAS